MKTPASLRHVEDIVTFVGSKRTDTRPESGRTRQLKKTDISSDLLDECSDDIEVRDLCMTKHSSSTDKLQCRPYKRNSYMRCRNVKSPLQTDTASSLSLPIIKTSGTRSPCSSRGRTNTEGHELSPPASHDGISGMRKLNGKVTSGITSTCTGLENAFRITRTDNMLLAKRFHRLSTKSELSRTVGTCNPVVGLETMDTIKSASMFPQLVSTKQTQNTVNNTLEIEPNDLSTVIKSTSKDKLPKFRVQRKQHHNGDKDSTSSFIISMNSNSSVTSEDKAHKKLNHCSTTSRKTRGEILKLKTNELKSKGFQWPKKVMETDTRMDPENAKTTKHPHSFRDNESKREANVTTSWTLKAKGSSESKSSVDEAIDKPLRSRRANSRLIDHLERLDMSCTPATTGNLSPSSPSKRTLTETSETFATADNNICASQILKHGSHNTDTTGKHKIPTESPREYTFKAIQSGDEARFIRLHDNDCKTEGDNMTGRQVRKHPLENNNSTKTFLEMLHSQKNKLRPTRQTFHPTAWKSPDFQIEDLRPMHERPVLQESPTKHIHENIRNTPYHSDVRMDPAEKTHRKITATKTCDVGCQYSPPLLDRGSMGSSGHAGLVKNKELGKECNTKVRGKTPKKYEKLNNINCEYVNNDPSPSLFCNYSSPERKKKERHGTCSASPTRRWVMDAKIRTGQDPVYNEEAGNIRYTMTSPPLVTSPFTSPPPLGRSNNCQSDMRPLIPPPPPPLPLTVNRQSSSTQLASVETHRNENHSNTRGVSPSPRRSLSSWTSQNSSAARLSMKQLQQIVEDTKQSCHNNARMNTNANYEPSNGWNEPSNDDASSAFIGEYLLQLWKTQCLCDVQVQVNGSTFMVHKLVLAAYSDIFCPTTPQPAPSVCFEIPSTSPEAVYQIFRYLYTSTMELGDELLEPALNAALFLGINEVVDVIKEILSEPTIDSLKLYVDIRNRHGLPCSIFDHIDIVRENFKEFVDSDVFLQLDLQSLQTLLEDPYILVESELETVRAVVNWIQYNPMERMDMLPELLENVNFECISPATISTLTHDYSHLFRAPDVQEVISDAFKFHALKNSSSGAGQIYSNRQLAPSTSSLSPPKNELHMGFNDARRQFLSRMSSSPDAHSMRQSRQGSILSKNCCTSPSWPSGQSRTSIKSGGMPPVRFSAQSQSQPRQSAQSLGLPRLSAQSQGQTRLSAQSQGHPRLSVQSQGHPRLSAQSQGHPRLSAQSLGQPLRSTHSLGQPLLSAQSLDQPRLSAQSLGQPRMSAQSQGQPRLSAQSLRKESKLRQMSTFPSGSDSVPDNRNSFYTSRHSVARKPSRIVQRTNSLRNESLPAMSPSYYSGPRQSAMSQRVISDPYLPSGMTTPAPKSSYGVHQTGLHRRSRGVSFGESMIEHYYNNNNAVRSIKSSGGNSRAQRTQTLHPTIARALKGGVKLKPNFKVRSKRKRRNQRNSIVSTANIHIHIGSDIEDVRKESPPIEDNVSKMRLHSHSDRFETFHSKTFENNDYFNELNNNLNAIAYCWSPTSNQTDEYSREVSRSVLGHDDQISAFSVYKSRPTDRKAERNTACVMPPSESSSQRKTPPESILLLSPDESFISNLYDDLHVDTDANNSHPTSTGSYGAHSAATEEHIEGAYVHAPLVQDYSSSDTLLQSKASSCSDNCPRSFKSPFVDGDTSSRRDSASSGITTNAKHEDYFTYLYEGRNGVTLRAALLDNCWDNLTKDAQISDLGTVTIFDDCCSTDNSHSEDISDGIKPWRTDRAMIASHQRILTGTECLYSLAFAGHSTPNLGISCSSITTHAQDLNTDTVSSSMEDIDCSNWQI